MHVLLLLFGWAVFLWFWFIVFGQAWSSTDLWVLLTVSAILFPAVTIAWVLHNLSLYQRKGPRRNVPAVDAAYTVDFYGRRIVADWARLAGQRRISIAVDGSVKRYLANDGDRGPAAGLGS